VLRLVVTLILCSVPFLFVFADDSRQAERYVKEAEYYQKKADGYRLEAHYYLKQADGYEREAAYYTRKGKTDRAKYYQRKASQAMDGHRTQMRYAARAEDKAADYLKRASRLLQQ